MLNEEKLQDRVTQHRAEPILCKEVSLDIAILEQAVPTNKEVRKEEEDILAQDIANTQLATAARVARLTEEVIKVAAVIEVRTSLRRIHSLSTSADHEQYGCKGSICMVATF